jgi:hypothetical protein
MTVEKVIENGLTYRVETDGSTTVKMKMEPELVYGAVPETVTSGQVISIPMHLQDFDGAARTDDVDAIFLVGGEQVTVPVTGGRLTLELELVTRGRQRIAAIPFGLTMTPIEIEVV